MNRSIRSLVLFAVRLSILCTNSALAVPVLQVYIEGATPSTIGPDEQTWFTSSNTFDLVVAGAYGPKTKSLTEITLLISVPENELGTITIAGEEATLLSEQDAAAGCHDNPAADADLDLLFNEPGNSDGYDGYGDKGFLPGKAHFNNHYPLKADVSNFLLYEIGDFQKLEHAVANYDTGAGISHNIAAGQQKVYSVVVSGFSSVHFDVYGYEQFCKSKGPSGRWVINPGSHDAAYVVPEPATMVLLGLGTTVLLKPRRLPSSRASR